MSTDDSVVTEEPTSHPLTGRFFHTTRTCHHGARVAQWQGQILAAIPPDVLLIELCDWIIGEPSGQELITLTDPEVLELASLLDALARAHGLTRKDNQ